MTVHEAMLDSLGKYKIKSVTYGVRLNRKNVNKYIDDLWLAIFSYEDDVTVRIDEKPVGLFGRHVVIDITIEIT